MMVAAVIGNVHGVVHVIGLDGVIADSDAKNHGF